MALHLEQLAGHMDHHLRCPSTQMAMQESLKMISININRRLATNKPLFLLQNVLIVPLVVSLHRSFHSMSPSMRCQLQRVQRPSTNFKNRHSFLLRLSFLNGDLPQNLNHWQLSSTNTCPVSHSEVM